MALSMPSMLSKSRFLAGRQCHLRLWYQCYQPHLARETSPGQQALFDTGREVGRLATGLYPSGIRIEADYRHHEQAVQSTIAAMQDAGVGAIYEAAFVHSDVRVWVDILERFRGASWNLVEVKSATSVKDVHIDDVAVQNFVLAGCGIDINRTGILHINNQYVFDGKHLDLGSLFIFSDLTPQVAARQPEIATNVKALRDIITGKAAPEITPSRHCLKPYLCEFWDHCRQKMPDYWVLNLSGIEQDKLDELLSLGVQDIRDIPDSFPLNRIQGRIRTSVINKEEYVSGQLEIELKDIAYPLHFLDFETVSPAIPLYAGTRPFQALPFQWSNHMLLENGQLTHNEYLCTEDKDPRREFASSLLECLGTEGTILIYTTYEKTVIRQLAEYLPDYRTPLEAMLSRFKDLCAFIRQFYYHPEFYGSFSLKNVLPALLPEMSYQTLSIRDGNQASLEYLKMINSCTPLAEKNKIRKNLLAYCGHDTLAMVRIREELLRRF